MQKFGVIYSYEYTAGIRSIMIKKLYKNKTMDKMNIMMNVSKKWKGTTGIIVYLENVESQGSMNMQFTTTIYLQFCKILILEILT